jgi:hypothetical protein
MQLDLGLVATIVGGVVAICLAVLAGAASARIFFRASRVEDEES